MDPENTSIRFRASKRKAMRARDTTPSPDSDKGVIRARNKSRRVRGVEMSSASGGAAAQQQQRSADQGKAMTERFTHQTGLISDLDDRHMYRKSPFFSRGVWGLARERERETNQSRNEYIESRLSASAQPPVLHAARPAPPRLADGESPTKLGKLFEVDVSHVEHKPQQARATRGQKRPGSDDLKLGHFVEQFLNENKLQVFDLSSQAIPPPSAGDHRSADDRLADEYRRRHNDQVALRRQRRRPAQPPRPPPPPGEVLRGPKLGGSRNQRAAIRGILLQQERDRAMAGAPPPSRSKRH